MKIQAEISGETREVELQRDGEKVYATVDGREYELEASQPEPNIWLLKHEGRIFEVFVSPKARPGEPVEVRVGRQRIDVTLIDPKRLRGAGAGHAHGDGTAEIRTAMPGKVVRVLVEAGAEVAKGDGIVVVEAMKMQNELRSPKDGRVIEIRGEEGATVEAGAVLAVIE